MGVLIKSVTGFKKRKDYINIFKSNMVIINTKEKGDDNFSNSNNNKNYKKIRVSKFNKYYGE